MVSGDLGCVQCGTARAEDWQGLGEHALDHREDGVLLALGLTVLALEPGPLQQGGLKGMILMPR